MLPLKCLSLLKKMIGIFTFLKQISNQVVILPPVSCSVAGLQETTITVTEKAVKEVMKLDDEIFSKFYRRVAEFPRVPSRIEIHEDFDAIFGSQAPK